MLVAFRISVACCKIKNPILWTEYARPFGATKMRCGFGQRIEHGLQIERRAADDLEYICGRRLLLQGLSQLVQQPSVLDGNYCLAREVRNQRDLLVGERADFRAVDDERSDQLVLPSHWHSDKGARAAVLGRRARAS